MRALMVILITVVMMGIPLAQGASDIKSGAVPMTEELVKEVAGDGGWFYRSETVSVASKLYNDYGYIGNGDWVTFDIRGWDAFIAKIGIDDNKEGSTGNTTILVDGEQVISKPVKHGMQAVSVLVPLTGKQTMTIRKSGPVRFIEPVMAKGRQFVTPSSTTGTGSSAPPATAAPSAPPPNQSTAPFVVDPNALDKLSTALRKRVDAKLEVQQKLAKGSIAVMTFDLVDIQSPSIGKNVAEDLSTSLINNDFQLVERGQLDKVLKELKIQDTALINQTTAQRIGQLTGCNYILVGSVSDRGQFLVINARFLETATGKAVAAERVECRKIEIKR